MAIILREYVLDEYTLELLQGGRVLLADIIRSLNSIGQYRYTLESRGENEATVTAALNSRMTEISGMKSDLSTLLSGINITPIPRIVPGAPAHQRHVTLVNGTGSPVPYGRSFIIPSPLPSSGDYRVFNEMFTWDDNDEWRILLTATEAIANSGFQANVIEDFPSILEGVSGYFVGWDNEGDTSDWNGFVHLTGNTLPLVQHASRMLYPMLPGYYYEITWEITGRTAGSVTLQVGTTETIGTQELQSTNAVFTTTVFCPHGTAPYLAFIPSSSFDGTLVAPTMKPLDWLYLDGRLPEETEEDSSAIVNVILHQSGTP